MQALVQAMEGSWCLKSGLQMLQKEPEHPTRERGYPVSLLAFCVSYGIDVPTRSSVWTLNIRGQKLPTAENPIVKNKGSSDQPAPLRQQQSAQREDVMQCSLVYTDGPFCRGLLYATMTSLSGAPQLI